MDGDTRAPLRSSDAPTDFGGLDPSPEAITGFGPFDSGPTVSDRGGTAALGSGTPQPAGYSALDEPGPLAIGQAFGPRYLIVRLLGLGGMGAVYQAWDQELGVAVALKVIRPEATGDPAAARDLERRFKRELVLARQVTHKNVVRIHDLGEIDGIKYITMSYIEGSDLATILRTQKTLDVPTALATARDIVAGLEAAHESGIVHRDLKPANIMVDGDHAVIMDFGIARSASRVGSMPHGGSVSAAVAPRQAMAALGSTMAGSIVGTIEYMAPEQARAEAVDQRADIYAFGLIFYDMLLGARCASGATTAYDDLQKRLVQAPPSPRTINGAIPEAIDRIVTRCVQPDPASRYQTTAELAADINALDANGIPLPVPRRFTPQMIVAAVTAVVALLTGTWWLARTPPVVHHPPVTVLVADVDNQAHEPLLDGTLEPAFATALEEASFLSAYKRGPARAIAGQMRPGFKTMDEELARLVAGREGVNVVIVSAVSREGNGYRISAKAVDAATGKQIARREVTVANRDALLPAVGKLAAPIRKALGDTTPESQQLAAAETFTAASLDAAHEYSVGQQLFDQSKSLDAMEHYRKAVQLDPKLGRAYSGLAVASINLKHLDDAANYYKTALNLLDRMSERERLRTLGTYYSAFLHNYDQATKTYEKLVSEYPGDVAAYNNLSIAYIFRLDFTKAVEAIRHAIELGPNNAKYHLNYALYSMYAGDFATAISEAQRIAATNATAYLPLALSKLARGDAQGARDGYANLEKVRPSVAHMGQADLEMYFGRYKAALILLDQGIAADAASKNDGEMALKYIAKAEAHLALGQKPKALQAARKAAQLSLDESVRFPAARALIAAGDEAGAEKIAAALDDTLQTQSRSYAQLIRAEIALEHRRYAEAIDAVRAAQNQRDSWISHFLLGRAYLDAGHFVEALANFDACDKRQGETADLMFADTATLRYLPPLFFWTARAQAGSGVTAAANDNFRKFIALRADADTPDPLVTAARRALSQ